MTQPIAPGTPAAPATPVAVRQGNVYLTSPITGEVKEASPDEAAALLQTGWVPNTEQSAEAIRAEQIPGEYVATQGDLGKFGYGVARGVLTPLVDLSLPQGSRVNEVLAGDSPWLVGGGEAAGAIGSAVLGLGPAAALEQGAARVATKLGAGNGLVRTAFGRAVQGGLEGGAYGAMGAISEAHSQNVPLTAQRLGSEILPGLLFGGILGGGLGALEGLSAFGPKGTLPERLAAVDKSKLDDIFRAGVSDEDALRLAQRELGVKDPGALERFQALANGDVTPERLALLKDPGPAGQRARRDAFQSAEQLSEAERQVMNVGNDYLVGREEALKQINSDLKRGHIEAMVGPGEADAGAIGKLVREHVGSEDIGKTVLGREVLNPNYTQGVEIAEAAGRPSKYPELLDYAGDSVELNQYLRKRAAGLVPVDEGLEAKAKGLEQDIQRALDAGAGVRAKLYRGEAVAPERLPSIKVGEELDFPSFVSTSQNADKAMEFANEPLDFVGPGGRKVLYTLEDQGVPMPYLRGEREVLLSPGKFKVKSVADDGDFLQVELERVGATKAPDPRAVAREQFVDQVLGKIDVPTEAVLARSLGASPENLRERIIQGLASGQNETIDALQAAMGKMKLTDEALQSFGAQGAWNQGPLDFVAKWRGELEGLAALPKGVNDNAGDIKKLLGNLDMAEQSLLRDRRAVAAGALDDVKKRLADFAEAGERLGPGSGVPAAARAMYEDMRLILEDPTIWGPKFAGFQSRVNQLLHQNFGVAGEFDDLFVKTIGKPDPENPWRNARVVDNQKVSKALADMSEPKRLAELDRIRKHLEDQKQFFKEIEALKLPATSYVRIRNAIKQIDDLRSAIDRGVYLNAAQRQGQALLGYAPLGSGRAVIGAVLGGLPGAAAGAMASAALNPGKMLQFRAIAERMAESTGSRVWRGVSKLLGLRIGDVAREGAGFIGKAAGRAKNAPGRTGLLVSAMLNERGDERARTYSQTVKQLTEARQRLPELASHLDETMPVLEQALPGTKAQMMAQAQRGLDYVLAHLPSQPRMRLYGETAPPLNDHDYEQFVRMAVAATDPPSILEMAEDGELTPAAVAAAEYAAPELVEYIRTEAVRAIQDHGPERVPYTNRISASLLLGTPLDESLEPEYIAVQQSTHDARTQMAMERRERGGGGGGETGVNKRYMQSESDRLESGEPPR